MTSSVGNSVSPTIGSGPRPGADHGSSTSVVAGVRWRCMRRRHHDVDVIGVTISTQQASLARQRFDRRRAGRSYRDPDPGLPGRARRTVRRDLVDRYGRTRRSPRTWFATSSTPYHLLRPMADASSTTRSLRRWHRGLGRRRSSDRMSSRTENSSTSGEHDFKMEQARFRDRATWRTSASTTPRRRLPVDRQPRRPNWDTAVEFVGEATSSSLVAVHVGQHERLRREPDPGPPDPRGQSVPRPQLGDAGDPRWLVVIRR